MACVRFGKILPLAGVMALLAPMATQGESLSVLQFFSDGCGVTAPDAVTFCKRGGKSGESCTPRPEFDPSFPSFSPDCCADLNLCFTNDPDSECAEATRLRCTSGRGGSPCLVDSECDSFLCVAGDPNTLGEPCTNNLVCEGVPGGFHEGEGVCEGEDGACTLDLSESVMGNVMKVTDNVGLVAVVTGTSIVPQPSYNKKDRLQVDIDFQLFDLDELVFVDPSLCTLPIRFGLQIRLTEGVLDSTVEP